MNKIVTTSLLSLAAAAVLAAAPAVAGYKLMPAARPVAVAKSGLTVTPPEDWNRLGARLGRNAESWTLNGLSVDDVTFYGGIPADQTLFREVDKRNRPLPRFAANMLVPDIVQLFENSYRIANNSSLFTIDAIEPARFAGQDGFRFAYSFVQQNDEVRRKGEARGAVIGGRLYLITFEAPAVHYFDRHLAAYRKLADSARIAAAPR